ncbi:MAG TPA: FAD-dependent oxidoreductase, partial [Pyrinomonadaceae bacterium]|nr:FAD-dependent oxidoreductase [Pyrinomonadaceae bacterium]
MTHEVVVVGGGIGGLTVAALLAARGVDVCLLERQSRVGGCVAAFEKFGYTFDPGVGLYPLWEAGEIHDQIFSELPVERPDVLSDDPAYVVRLPDQTDFSITTDNEQFETSLLTSFPECADRAIAFYQDSAKVSADLWTTDRNINSQTGTVFDHLEGTSFRFRRFIEVQLRLLVQVPPNECDYRYGSFALNILRKGNFSIRGGAPALADKLAESIRTSGGRVRLDTTALRLAYDSAG